MLKFALAGNPNCGKTTLFNALTGSTAHVGNWPGVTVDKKEGTYKKLPEPVAIVDLPGIYSLSPYTPEEVISRNYIIDEKPDCVINIIDATNLERNLYLTTQIMEIDVPVVVALNMMDAVKKSGDKLDAVKLERALGIPVVEISALKNEGIPALMERAWQAAACAREGSTVLRGSALSHVIDDVKIALKGKGVPSPLFHAVKLVEGDELEVKNHPDEVAMVEAFKEQHSDDVFGGDFEAMVADERYKYISAHFSTAFTRAQKSEKLTKSDKADRVLTHRIWGIPIFLVILFAIFHLTFGEDLLYLNAMFGFAKDVDGSGYAVLTGNDVLNAFIAVFYSTAGVSTPGAIVFNLMGFVTDQIGGGIAAGLENAGAYEWAQGLVNDGIWGGLSGILSFIPQILVLFLFISILEDSGYMARVAFILDRAFRKFGLSGRAFIPMIMGFGCSVPAAINTRTLADEKERIMTNRVIPFFTCGAKAPILAAVCGAIASEFTGVNADLLVFALFAAATVFVFLKAMYDQSAWFAGSFALFMLLGLYFRTFNTVRYYFVLAVTLYSLRYVLKREYGKFVLMILGAALFHKSVLVVIPLVWAYPQAFVCAEGGEWRSAAQGERKERRGAQELFPSRPEGEGGNFVERRGVTLPPRKEGVAAKLLGTERGERRLCARARAVEERGGRGEEDVRLLQRITRAGRGRAPLEGAARGGTQGDEQGEAAAHRREEAGGSHAALPHPHRGAEGIVQPEERGVRRALFQAEAGGTEGRERGTHLFGEGALLVVDERGAAVRAQRG